MSILEYEVTEYIVQVSFEPLLPTAGLRGLTYGHPFDHESRPAVANHCLTRCHTVCILILSCLRL